MKNPVKLLRFSIVQFLSLCCTTSSGNCLENPAVQTDRVSLLLPSLPSVLNILNASPPSTPLSSLSVGHLTFHKGQFKKHKRDVLDTLLGVAVMSFTQTSERNDSTTLLCSPSELRLMGTSLSLPIFEREVRPLVTANVRIRS